MEQVPSWLLLAARQPSGTQPLSIAEQSKGRPIRARMRQSTNKPAQMSPTGRLSNALLEGAFTIQAEDSGVAGPDCPEDTGEFEATC